MSYDYSRMAYAYSRPESSGLLKSTPAHFRVNEHIPFELTGEGEHVWLYIQKRNTNTQWLARQLAKLAGVRRMGVGYAGLKDRLAITQQWFSVLVHPDKEPDWSQIESEDIQIQQRTRSQRKLKRGAHDFNAFEIHLTQLEGDVDLLTTRLQQIQKQGVPNYFGEQRFGHGGGNIIKALDMFAGKHRRVPREKRSIYLSAARSWLFNDIVSERVKSNNWCRQLSGDVYMLNGSKVCFPDDQSRDLASRLVAGDIHPTAPLWGEGEAATSAQCAELEQSVICRYPELADGLIQARVALHRRACRLLPGAMSWLFDNDELIVKFRLPAGAYATSVLRELVAFGVPSLNSTPSTSVALSDTPGD